MDTLLRIGVAAALLVALIAGVRLAGWLFAARTRRLVASLNESARAAEARVLYFTSERCAVCRLRQEPELKALAATAPEPLQVESFDAARDRGVASTYRILTAPSTVVIRRDGRVAAINHGFAPATRLAEQLGWSA